MPSVAKITQHRHQVNETWGCSIGGLTLTLGE